VPGACDIAVCDDGAAFKIPVSFVPRGSSRPRGVHAPRHLPPVARLTGGSAFPAGVAGTSQAVLFHRLGFPHAEQWQHVPSGTTGHGLPPTTTLKGDLPLRDAVAKGRSRAASFRPTVTPEPQPAPGAWVYMDFAGPLIPSVVHSYVAFCCTVDPGSGYGRVWPCHHMTASVAQASLERFIADLRVKQGLTESFKPQVVRSDQGPAFVSHHFREFLSAQHMQQSLSCIYQPLPRLTSKSDIYINKCYLFYNSSRATACLVTLQRMHIKTLAQLECRWMILLSRR